MLGSVARLDCAVFARLVRAAFARFGRLIAENVTRHLGHRVRQRLGCPLGLVEVRRRAVRDRGGLPVDAVIGVVVLERLAGHSFSMG